MILVLNGKGLLLEGSNPSIEDKHVPGIYIYIIYVIYAYLYLEAETFIYKWLFQLDYFKTLHWEMVGNHHFHPL